MFPLQKIFNYSSICLLLLSCSGNNAKIQTTAATCAQNCENTKQTGSATVAELNGENPLLLKTVDILPDTKFLHGFSGANSPGNAPKINPNSPLRPPNDSVLPSWSLAQFWSQEGLTGAGVVNSGCQRRWINKYKGVSLGCLNSGQTYDLVLGFNSLTEYNNTFKVFTPDATGKYHWPDNPKWVHFGVRATPKSAPTLNHIGKLVFNMKAKLFGSQIFKPENCPEPRCHSLENYSPIKSKIHIAAGIVVRNMNIASKYYMQGVTLGVSMYDTSEKISGPQQMVDPVMGILMQRLDQAVYTNNASMHSGNEVTFKGDFISELKKSIDYACHHPIPSSNVNNFFGSCNLSDYAITQFLLNWEVHGLGTATIGIRDLHLYMTSN